MLFSECCVNIDIHTCVTERICLDDGGQDETLDRPNNQTNHCNPQSTALSFQP